MVSRAIQLEGASSGAQTDPDLSCAAANSWGTSVGSGAISLTRACVIGGLMDWLGAVTLGSGACSYLVQAASVADHCVQARVFAVFAAQTAIHQHTAGVSPASLRVAGRCGV